MKKRIWELDALRGFCILAVIAVHLVYDLTHLYRVFRLDSPLFDFIAHWGGMIFLIISGISITLGSHPVRRGILVLLCGLLVTGVTAGMHLLGLQGKSIIIYFGVLHCLGICMLLWPVFRKSPVWLLGLLALAAIALGHYWDLCVTTDHPWFVPLGITYPGFASADYFPLFPSLGYFLLGAFVGKTLYRKKESLLPKVDPRLLPIRFLTLCGKYSLFIYLLHQPLITGIIELCLLF